MRSLAAYPEMMGDQTVARHTHDNPVIPLIHRISERKPYSHPVICPSGAIYTVVEIIVLSSENSIADTPVSFHLILCGRPVMKRPGLVPGIDQLIQDI